MLRKAVTVGSQWGVHLRVASSIAEISRKYECEVWLSMDGLEAVPGDSILAILSLGAASGSQLTISAEGHKETEAMARVIEALSDGAGI